jgi:hypothetical protein
MKKGFTFLALSVFVAAIAQFMFAQEGGLAVPKVVEVGSAFSISTGGSGKATLYLVSPAGVFRRSAQPGEPLAFRSGEVINAGHYVALLVGESSTLEAEFDVVARTPTGLSFLAKPSRLAVSQTAGISGVAYVFDSFHNLVLSSLPVTFRLSGIAAPPQAETVSTRNGVAWIRMNSSPKAGLAEFDAVAGTLSEKRVVQLIPGDPCSLQMDARRSGSQMLLQTQPVRDCSGNAVPDGTSVTFTETRKGHTAASVDVPLKHDIAQTELPAYDGAVLSVATGVVMGNEIRVGETR